MHISEGNQHPEAVWLRCQLSLRARRGNERLHDLNHFNRVPNPRYNIILTREDVNNVDLQVLVFPLSNSLGIVSDYLRERFDEAKSLPTCTSSNIKENASPPISPG